MDEINLIGDPTRRAIVELLAKNKSMRMSHIHSKFKISRSAISQHLKVLREAGIVRATSLSQMRFYELNPKFLLELQKWILRLSKEFGIQKSD
jgi:DNA-binding transcriptional ArsR family regulator